MHTTTPNRLQIGLRERLIGPCVPSIPDPPVITGWRLVDLEEVTPADGAELLVLIRVRVGRGRRSRVRFTPTADAYYLRDAR
jgi:hypothetical protein